MSTRLMLMIFLLGVSIERSRAAVGEKKRPVSTQPEGLLSGHYLLLAQTAYLSNTPAFLTLTTASDLECRCACSRYRQCLSMTYRSTDALCSLYANDPCNARTWQSSAETNFAIHVQRLKYRLFEQPEQNEPLRRLSASALCGNTNGFDADRRWLYVVKIGGQSKDHFDGLNFEQAPNQVAPSPWSTTSMETIWNSVLMSQW